MKKSLTPLVLSLSLLNLAGAAQFAYDSFTAVADPTSPGNGEYDDDLALSEVGQVAPSVSVPNVYEHGWTGDWTIEFADSPGIDGLGGLSYLGLPSTGGAIDSGTGGRVERVLATAYDGGSSGTVYLSFMMKANTDNPGDVGTFELWNGGDRKVQIGYGENASNDYAVRLFDSNSFYASLDSENQDVNFFVVKCTFGTENNEDSIEVWYNPAGRELSSEAAAGAADYSQGDINLGFDRISVNNSFSLVKWDEIRLGDNWEDVVLKTGAYDSFSAASTPGNGEYDDDLTLTDASQAAPTVDVLDVYEHGWTGEWLLDNDNSPDVIGSSGLSYGGVSTAGGSIELGDSIDGRAGRLLDQPITEASKGELYISLLMQVDDTNNNYRAFELHDGGFADNPDRKLQLGIGENGSSDYFVQLFSNNAFYGSLGAINTDVNLAVLKFTFETADNGDSIDVWFNPTGAELNSEAAAGAADYTASGFNMDFDRVTVANFGSGAVWDELRLGCSWTEVVASAGSLTAPILSITINGNDADVSFDSADGITYQLQKRSSLQSSSWSNVSGAVVTNSGGGIETLTDTAALTGNTIGFYRVVAIR